jgi:phage N-6-adenine-methyltransferase
MPIPVNTLTGEALKREWRTPDWVYIPLNRVFQFTLDAAATEANTKCKRWIDEQIDALGHPDPWGSNWRTHEGAFATVHRPPERIWLNPPHSRRDNVRDWIARVRKETLDHGHLVVALLPASTGTIWYHEYIHNIATLFLIRGRVQYGPPEGYVPIDGKLSGPTFDSMIAIWWPFGMAIGGVGSIEFVKEEESKVYHGEDMIGD